jgi:pimeloyl-ACP methyl ester carboxylesterase
LTGAGEAIAGPATFVLIHGGGDGAWNWHLTEAGLRAGGHDVVAVDLPTDESAGLNECADAVVAAIGGRTRLVVVAHSFGGFVAPLVCDRLAAEALVLVAGMVPAPGEAPRDWWDNTGLPTARSESGFDGLDDFATYYHDVAPDLAAEAISRERSFPSMRTYDEPWPRAAWPDVSTHYLLCGDDRLLPPAWTRQMVRERLGITADEIDGGHCVMLSRPTELARRLASYSVRARMSDR